MQLSNQGFVALDLEEGDVLRAYRDVAGVLTISRGLTAASGVVKPVPGMVITQEESDRLTRLALARNYEPAVAKAMAPGKPAQHEFDAGVLFHWNTGAIARATWVQLWLKRAWASAEPAFKSWNKAKGKVVGGLVRRREREFMILRFGQYPDVVRKPTATVGSDVFAKIASPVTFEQVVTFHQDLKDLGYAAGDTASLILASALRQFQRDHDLTVDGILGRATAATIQRRIDAKAKSKTVGAVSVGGAGAGTADMATASAADPMPWIGPCLIVSAVLLSAWLAWRYRDVVAAKIQRRLPKVAAYLRSI